MGYGTVSIIGVVLKAIIGVEIQTEGDQIFVETKSLVVRVFQSISLLIAILTILQGLYGTASSSKVLK
jgi:hypothetical protein